MGLAVKEVHVEDWEARCGSATVSFQNASVEHQILCLQTAPAQNQARRWKRLSGAVRHPVDQVGGKQEKVGQVVVVVVVAQALAQDQAEVAVAEGEAASVG